MFLMTDRNPSLTLVMLVTSGSYSHKLFLCANVRSLQRSLSFLNGCQIWFWSCESETSTAISSSVWFSWCWYAFFFCPTVWSSSFDIRVMKKNKTTSLWKKDEPERTQKLLLGNSCYKRVPMWPWNPKFRLCFQSVVESRGHAGKINS